MTLSSMTGFARCAVESPLGRGSWELRSVNHRYSEWNIKLPESWRGLEARVREALKKEVRRGKVDVFWHWQWTSQGQLSYDTASWGAYVSMLRDLHRVYPEAHAPSLAEVLQLPGMVQLSHDASPELEAAVWAGFETALAAFLRMREDEGLAIAAVLRASMATLLALVEGIIPLLPEHLRLLEAKWRARVETFAGEVDAARFSQELAHHSTRVDIQEELDRLRLHAQAFLQAMEEGFDVGRRLDFLLQELHREANTLGSKSQFYEIQKRVVDLKACIDAMREQVQNIA